MNKKLPVAAIFLGAVALGGTALAANADRSESSRPNSPSSYTSDWSPSGASEASKADVSDLHVITTDTTGASLSGTPLVTEPAPGVRIGLQRVADGSWCVQANHGARNIVMWCGAYFGEEGVNYAYNTGNVPGLQSSLVGLAMPDVSEITVKTTQGTSDARIVNGTFWWEGAPGERVVELNVTRNGVSYTDTSKFAPVDDAK